MLLARSLVMALSHLAILLTVCGSQLIIKQNDEYSYFELHIFIAEEFIMNILGFSGEIEVLEPVSLRQEIIERVNQLNKSYSLS